MRATELFQDAEEFEVDFGGPEGGAEDVMDGDIEGLRLLELDDCDVSPLAIDAMESGRVQSWTASSVDEVESRLVTDEEGYSVRVALIDATAAHAEKALDRAILSEVDLIVVAPLSSPKMAGALTDRLSEAARTGHGVFTIN